MVRECTCLKESMTFNGDTGGTVWGQCGLDSINKLRGALSNSVLSLELNTLTVTP